ncbi:MAG: MFS transporter [Gammaproteobacteria bacterium]
MSSTTQAQGAGFTPWYHGWNVIGTTLLFQAASVGTVTFCFTFWVAPWMSEFGVSRAALLSVLFAQQIASGFAYPIVGWAISRVPIRWVVASGMLALALGLCLAANATQYWHIMVIFTFVMSMVTGLAGAVPAQALATNWFDKNRGFAIGLTTLGTSIGGVIMPPLAAFLIAELGWRHAAYAIAAITTIAVVPVVMLVVRNAPVAAASPAAAGAGHKPAAGGGWTAADVLRQSAFWILIVAMLPAMTANNSLIANLAPFATDLEIPAQRAALLLSCLNLAMIAGKLMFGTLADRVEHRMLLGGALGLFAVALVLVANAADYGELLVVFAILGLAAGGMLPLLGAILARSFGPQSFGLVLGLAMLSIRPVAFGGPLAGHVRDRFGSYDMFFYAATIVILACMVPLLWFRAPRARA